MFRSIALLALTTATIAAPFALNAESTAAVPEKTATEVIIRLADSLESNFVYVESGRAYAAMLRSNVATGKYADIAGADLADRLTADLQAVAPDGHLRVRFAGGEAVARAGPRPMGGPPGQRPPAIELERWIAPGIAFVRLNLFPFAPDVTERTAKFMADHADAKAIIFDIRTHGGGGLDQMDRILPWLFDKPTRLVTMATRKSVEAARGSPIAGVPSLRIIEADPGYVTREHWVKPNDDARLHDARVYLLTSDVTGSAAEHFSLAMKHTGRGKLVGSHTAGANHFGGMEDLGGGFSAFIPVGRTYDPVTGKDWEGDGVLPDIDVPPEQALIRVLQMEDVEPAEAERLSAELPMPQLRRPGARPR